MALMETPICDFGLPAIDFKLPGVDGRTWTLNDARGANGLLVMFICNHCPYVKAVRARLIRETHDLKALGIGVIAISSNDPADYPEDSFDKMKKVAHEYSYPFPYVFDETQEVAKAYGAVCTPDFFGYNKELKLQYRGRLDASRKEPVANARRDLYEALQQIAQTGRGPTEQVASMGCSIKWKGG
ncbi:MAG: thioredoxin family protein [Gammaproteobacteria bacterium]|nr:thioredoxin family protein [Gammaproteobacteria bacterium]